MRGNPPATFPALHLQLHRSRTRIHSSASSNAISASPRRRRIYRRGCAATGREPREGKAAFSESITALRGAAGGSDTCRVAAELHGSKKHPTYPSIRPRVAAHRLSSPRAPLLSARVRGDGQKWVSGDGVTSLAPCLC